MFRNINIYRKILVVFIVSGFIIFLRLWIKNQNKYTIIRTYKPNPIRNQELFSNDQTVKVLKNNTPVIDDLTIIKGIGPKIAIILKLAGVNTISKLSKSNIEDLTQILKNANIRVSKIETWIDQAKIYNNH